MVAMEREGDNAGRLVHGDAVLTYAFLERSGMTLEAAFSRVRSVESGRAYRHSAFTLGRGGVHQSGSFRGNGFSGAFYGPNHAEATGTLDSHGLVGAFGTKRTR